MSAREQRASPAAGAGHSLDGALHLQLHQNVRITLSKAYQPDTVVHAQLT